MNEFEFYAGITPRPVTQPDPERFCRRCFAGLGSPEHHENCVRPAASEQADARGTCDTDALLCSDCPRRPGTPPGQEVHHPRHYNVHPSGVECIDVVGHMGFNLGNALKYLWRVDHKGQSTTDLGKALNYVMFEVTRRVDNGWTTPLTDDRGLAREAFERWLAFEPEGLVRRAAELVWRADDGVQPIEDLYSAGGCVRAEMARRMEES